MTISHDRVLRQIELIASVNPVEAIDICLSHYNCLVGIISSNCETDEEFIEVMTAMTAQAVRKQIAHRKELRAKGLII